MKKLTEDLIMKTLDYCYDTAVDGVVGLDSAVELSSSYTKKNNDITSAAESLVRWQVAKAGCSGFMTGLGGVLVLPVALPASIVSILFIQVRMIAAIAHMAGYDLKDDQVKTMVYACLCGSGITEVLKNAGIEIGKKLTISMIKGISREVITKINRAVGFRLLTKFGEKGAINLGKMVPLLGGVIGGTFDSVSTKLVGASAINALI